MAKYRVLGIIPTLATPPGAVDPVAMSAEELASAINSCAALVDRVYEYSNGLGSVEMDVLIWTENVTSEHYSQYGGQDFISPDKMSINVGLRQNYDYFMVPTSLAQTTVTTFRGLAIGRGWWLKINDVGTPYIGIHELAHKLEADLREDGYTNFPVCAENPNGTTSIHCNAKYGYQSAVDETYIRKWYSATLPDGTGMDATAWSMQTPLEQSPTLIAIPTPVRKRKSDPLCFRLTGPQDRLV